MELRYHRPGVPYLIYAQGKEISCYDTYPFSKSDTLKEPPIVTNEIIQESQTIEEFDSRYLEALPAPHLFNYQSYDYMMQYHSWHHFHPPQARAILNQS